MLYVYFTPRTPANKLSLLFVWVFTQIWVTGRPTRRPSYLCMGVCVCSRSWKISKANRRAHTHTCTTKPQKSTIQYKLKANFHLNKLIFRKKARQQLIVKCIVVTIYLATQYARLHLTPIHRHLQYYLYNHSNKARLVPRYRTDNLPIGGYVLNCWAQNFAQLVSGRPVEKNKSFRSLSRSFASSNRR